MVCEIDFVRLRMGRYYCPFCSPRYQLYKTRTDGVLICAHCGDPLVRKPLINSKKVFGLFVASIFLAPLLIMVVFIINDFNEEKVPKNSDSLLHTNLY